MERQFEEFNKYVQENEAIKAHHFMHDLSVSLNQELHESMIEEYILNIFNRASGLLHFIVETVNGKQFDKAIVKAFEVLYTFFNNFTSKLIKYTQDICDTCMKVVLTSKSTSIEKRRSLEVLKLVLEKSTCDTHNVKVIFDKLYNCAVNCVKQDLVAASLTNALGVVIRKHPSVIDEPTALFKILISKLHMTVVITANDADSVVASYFSCLSDLLENYESCELGKLYLCIKKIMGSSSYLKMGQRSGLSLLTKHSHLFSEDLCRDAQWWEGTLMQWLDLRGDNQKAGYMALDAIHHKLSQFVVTKNYHCIDNMCLVFITRFVEDVNNPLLYGYHRRLAIHGLGYFAEAAKKFLPQEQVNNLFIDIVHLIKKIYLVNNSIEQFEYLPDYIQTLSNVLKHVDNLSAYDVDVLEQSTVLMIRLYPHLSKMHHNLTISAISTSLFHLKSVRVNILEQFLQNIVYQGVIWSCCHMILVNAEMQKDTTTEEIVTYKNYVPLWCSLLKRESYEGVDADVNDPGVFITKIYDELLKTLLVLSNKLNLNTKTRDANVNFCDPNKNLEAIKVNDFDVFVNLVDLYVDILNEVDCNLFRKWRRMFLKENTIKSDKYPLVSGFYKLLAIGYKLCNKLNFTDNIEMNSVFILKIILKINNYKGDLKIACIQVILNTPISTVREILPKISMVFTSLFAIGRSNIQLANLAIDTLDYWHENIPQDEMEPFLKEILPSFDPFLSSKSISENFDGEPLKKRKTEQVLNRRKVVTFTEPELFNLQKKMLMFLGKLSGELCASLVNSDKVIEPVVWGKNHQIKLNLTCHDAELVMYLDKFVPRILELAVYCSERKLRLNACETLHSIIMILLGTSKLSEAKAKDLNTMLSKIAFPLLQLGCDSDHVVEAMFRPLVLQMMHWYSSHQQLYSSHTAILIETLMDGVTYANEHSLRDFACECIHEFISWTIKQTPPRESLKDSINVKIFIRKIKNFSFHTDPLKRLASALIFNNIYTELRENMSIIRTFWFELLHCFIVNLSMIEYYDEFNCLQQVGQALDHIERVLVERPNLFAKDQDRRIPGDFKGSTLNHAVIFLLEQTNSLNYNCRTRCMNMFLKLAPLVDGCAGVLQNFMEKNKSYFDVNWVSNLYEVHMQNEINLLGINEENLIKWMSRFLVALVGNIFVIENKIKPKMYDVYKTKFFDVLIQYLNQTNFDLVDWKSIENKHHYDTLKLLVSEKVINFLLLIKIERCETLDNLLERNGWDLFCKYIFDERNSSEEYNTSQLMHLVLEHCKTRQINNFLRDTYVRQDFKSVVPLKQRRLIRGLLLLKSSSKSTQITFETKGIVKDIVNNIFETRDGYLNVVSLPDVSRSYCETLLELGLHDDEEFLQLVRILCDSNLVRDPITNQTCTLGSYVYNNHKKVVVKFLIKKWEIFFEYIIENASLDVTCKFIDDILKSNTNFDLLNLIGGILIKWDTLANYFNESYEKRIFGLEIVDKMAQLLNNEAKKSLMLDDIRFWILEALLYEPDDLTLQQQFTLKMHALSAVSLVIDIEDDPQIEDILTQIQEKYFRNIEDKTKLVATILMTKAFETAVMSKSIIIFTFSGIIFTFLDKLNIDFNVGDSVRAYVLGLNDDLQVKALHKLYSYTKSENLPFDIRYNLTKIITSESLRCVDYVAFETFFIDIINKLMFNVSEANTSAEVIVTKTIDYILLKMLFSRINVSNFENKSCPITRAYTDVVINGKELLKKATSLTLMSLKEDPKKFKIDKELFRVYQCNCFNALVSIISNTKKDVMFYNWFFNQEVNGENVLWRHLIDVERNYTFEMDFDKLPTKTKTLVSIRSTLQVERRKTNLSQSVKYVETQTIFNSSLNEDICKYDFTNSILRSQLNTKNEEEMMIDIDSVEINSHECMATVCGLIQHMVEKNIFVTTSDLPTWMDSVRKELDGPHRSVKLYLAKLVENNQEVFKPYAKDFFKPIIKLIICEEAGSNINYFVSEIVLMLISWSENEKPIEEKHLATDLLEFLIDKVNCDRADMTKYHLELIKALVECWKSILDLPRLQTKLSTLPDTKKVLVVIKLHSIFLANNLQSWTSIEAFAKWMCKVLEKEETASIYKPCSETIGMALKFLLNKDLKNQDDLKAFAKLTVKKIKKCESNDNKYLYCLEAVAVHYPELCDEFVNKLIYNYKKYVSNFKRICLKIFLERIDYLHTLDDFVIVDLEELLSEYDADTQEISLQIVLKTIPKLNIDGDRRKLGLKISLGKFKTLVDCVCSFANNTSSKCRSVMYDILMYVYRNISDEEIIEKSKQILLQGIVDTNQDIEQKVTTFWRNEGNLPKNIFDRYIYILKNMYNPSIEKNYLGYFINFLLSEVVNSKKFNDPLFDYQLSDCQFNDYDIKDNWRARHISLAPMFASTYASQEVDPTFNYSNMDYVMATQTQKEFDPTLVPDMLENTTPDDVVMGGDGDFKKPHPVTRGLKKVHFYKDQNKAGRGFAFRHVDSAIKMQERRKDLTKERQQKVELYRKYRTGDFPDIQIKMSDLLGPLQLLTKNDTHIARIFYTALFETIFDKLPDDKLEVFIEKTAQGMNDVFSKSVQYNSNVMGAFLEVALAHRKQMQFQSDTLSRVCRYSGLSSIGTLLLEEYLIANDDGTDNSGKVQRGYSNDPETTYWVKLAELYKSMDEWDMVRAIFRVKMHCDEKIVQAINAESSCMWTLAQDLYREAINNDESLDRRDFYYESCYKCFAELSDWEKVTESIKSTVSNNDNLWSELWDDDWNQQKLLPWYIMAEIRNTLDDSDGRKSFLTKFQTALKDSTRIEYIKENFCEEYAFLLLSENEIDNSKHYLNIYVKNFLGVWSNTSPLLVASRTSKLVKMRNPIAMYEFLQKFSEIDCTDCDKFIDKFCIRWAKLRNESSSSVVPCETKYIYTNRFIQILKNKLRNSTYNSVLDNVVFNMEMNLIEISIKLSNLEHAKKLAKKHEDLIKGDANTDQHVIYRLMYIELVNLRAKSIPENENKLKFYMKMLEIMANLSDNPIVQENPKFLLQSSIAVNNLTENIGTVLESYNDLESKAHEWRKVARILNVDDAAFDVETFGYKHMEKTLMRCSNETQINEHQLIGEGYLKLADVACKKRGVYTKDYIVYVLRAMYYGSNDARQIFPCLLNIEDLGAVHGDAFIEESNKVPVWMFISWIPQLLANLDTERVFAISELVTNIAKTYPQAIMYAFRLSRQKYKFLDDRVGIFGQNIVKELNMLLSDPMVDKLLRALSSVSVPPTVLKYYMKRLAKACRINSENDFKEVISQLKEFCEEEMQVDDHFCTRGAVFKSINDCAKKIINLDVGKFNATKIEKLLQTITKEIENMEKKKSKYEKKLSYYSPWLEHLCESKFNLDIEIPGQYKGDRKPLIQYHVKICGFSPEVDMIKSLRKPIKLTFIGNDAKEYTFIVKFGEDLRQDQRIEQLFDVVNNVFKGDLICHEKRFNIRTYQVVPLTSSLGIIECVPETVTMQEFIEDVVSEGDLDKVAIKHMEKYLRSKTCLKKDYVKALLDQNIDKTIAIYRGLVSDVAWDVYRKAFWNRSINTESYIALRNKFITSHSISSVVNWLLGIGDRHLKNSLISVRNGGTVDIDFGHAFGTSVQLLPIPELVPFRLTPHIVNLMQPFDEHGLISETMVHVLRALRKNANILLATMDVFIKEPSLEWLEFMKYSEQSFSGGWDPREKMMQAQRKLNGANPSIIMAEEINSRASDERHVIKKYDLYIRGVAERNARARVGDDLSVEDQVRCLIDQATDYNLLGRMYCGWMSWV